VNNQNKFIKFPFSMKKLILPLPGIGGLTAIVLAIAHAKRHLAIVGGVVLLAAQTNAQILINGAGSTFDYPAFTKWFEAYGKQDPDVRFNYQSIGSGGGQKQLLNQTVDFGASDAPMTDESMSKAPGKILHLPVVAGGVAIIYNLKGDPKLKLDSDVIANIYLGNITKWNDPKIKALNPDVDLPDQPVIPVHRSEGSGTTFIFTDYLSSVNPAWADTVGKSTSVGYAELAYADQNKMPYADIKNATGNFISPTPDSVSAALATAKIPDDFRFSMVNAPGEKAYPIAGASWVLVYQQQKNADHGRKLVAFLKWAVTDGQKISSTLDYAPLPDSVQSRELDLIGTIR